MLIIGAMKSGTTKLIHDLDCIPEICLSARKETNFFIKAIKEDRLSQTNESSLLAKYQNGWPSLNPLKHQYALEVSTSYAKVPVQPMAAGLIRRVSESTSSSFKVIYIPRIPIDAVSPFYRHAFTSYLAWARNHRIAVLSHDILSRHLLAIYSYAKQLEKFSSWLSRESLLLINFSMFTQAPAEIAREVARFLGLDSCFEFEDSGVRHSSDARLESYRDIAEYTLPPDLANWKLSSSQRETIIHLLREDIKRLREVYEFDTSEWTEFN
ncbi:sulfotransferase [Cyanobium sp. Cruz-8H5]|nr:sulfotransferase [Cyanobium sp. Cruz-8H5]